MPPSADGLGCDAVLDRLEAYLDDELDDATRTSVRGHLERCPVCADEAATARRLLGQLRSLPELDPPPEIIDRVRTRIDETRRGRSRYPGNGRRLRWFAAAAGVLIAVGTISLNRLQPDAPSDEALRAAADVRLALATFGGITRRARNAAITEVIDQRVAPAAVRGLVRPLRLLSHDRPTGTPAAASRVNTNEGSS